MSSSRLSGEELKKVILDQLTSLGRRFDVKLDKSKVVNKRRVDVLKVGGFDCPVCGKESHFRIFIPIIDKSKTEIDRVKSNRRNLVSFLKNEVNFETVGYLCFRCSANKLIHFSGVYKYGFDYQTFKDLISDTSETVLQFLNRTFKKEVEEQNKINPEEVSYFRAINFLNSYNLNFYLFQFAEEYMKKRFPGAYFDKLRDLAKINRTMKILSFASNQLYPEADISKRESYLIGNRVCISSYYSGVWSCRAINDDIKVRYITLKKAAKHSLIVFRFNEKPKTYLFATEGIFDILSLMVVAPMNIIKKSIFISYNGISMSPQVYSYIKTQSDLRKLEKVFVIFDKDAVNKIPKSLLNSSSSYIFSGECKDFNEALQNGADFKNMIRSLKRVRKILLENSLKKVEKFL